MVKKLGEDGLEVLIVTIYKLVEDIISMLRTTNRLDKDMTEVKIGYNNL
jgi:hypothetical protein